MVIIMKNKKEELIIEYGNENLKSILFDYLKEKFIEILKNQ